MPKGLRSPLSDRIMIRTVGVPLWRQCRFCRRIIRIARLEMRESVFHATRVVVLLTIFARIRHTVAQKMVTKMGAVLAA